MAKIVHGLLWTGATIPKIAHAEPEQVEWMKFYFSGAADVKFKNCERLFSIVETDSGEWRFGERRWKE